MASSNGHPTESDDFHNTSTPLLFLREGALGCVQAERGITFCKNVKRLSRHECAIRMIALYAEIVFGVCVSLRQTDEDRTLAHEKAVAVCPSWVSDPERAG